MLAASFILLGAHIVLAFALPLDSPEATRWLVASVALAASLPFARMVFRRRIDLFELICPVAFSYFVYFVLGSREPIPEAGPTFPWLTDRHLNLALLYVGMGLSALYVGYYGSLPALLTRQLPRLRFTDLPARPYWVIYLLYFIGSAIRLFLVAHGSGTWSTKLEELEMGVKIPAYVGNLAYLNNLALFGYFLATTYYFSDKRARGLGFILWGIMFPCECLWVFLQGSKGLAIAVILSPLIAFNYLRRRVTVRQVALPALVFVFLVFPAISEYRTFAHKYPIQLSTVATDLPNIGKELFEGITAPESESYVARAPELVSVRASGVIQFANVIQYTEQNRLLHGETLWQFPMVVLPSFLVPQKYQHLASSGEIYREDVSGLYESTSGISIMQVGEFYLNFGLVGLLLLMCLQGVLYGTWQRYLTGSKNPSLIALYILGWRMLALIEFPIATAYGLLVRETLLMLPILWLVHQVKPGELSSGTGGAA